MTNINVRREFEHLDRDTLIDRAAAMAIALQEAIDHVKSVQLTLPAASVIHRWEIARTTDASEVAI